MCGIVCYVGDKEAKPILLEGLKRLEYRGYDSAGIAIQNSRHIHCCRSVGKIARLQKKLNGVPLNGVTGIAHTRWATHGAPTEENAHPHRDQHGDVFVTHNGIIENYFAIRKKLEKQGILFRSETDTEVLAHLIGLNFDGALNKAVMKTMAQVEGTFGLAVIHRRVPGEIVVARRGSSLVIGLSRDGHIAASDVSAMVRHTNQVIHLQEAGVYNHAGPEMGVASTKVFTSQLTILTLMAVLLGRHQRMSLTEGMASIRALEALPDQVARVLSQADRIQTIAEKYHKFNDWLFIGRKYNYPIALEGAFH